MKRLTKTAAVIILVILGVLLAGTVYARAASSEEIGVCWWRMNKAHEAADICRALGYENGTAEQKAALAEFGKTWTDANNTRKELETANRESLGTWTITAYCNDGQSASGRANIVGQTCACNCLPFGSVIEVEGMGRFTVTDRGASSGSWAWHNSAWADLYLGSESECNAWGVQKKKVWLVK